MDILLNYNILDIVKFRIKKQSVANFFTKKITLQYKLKFEYDKKSFGIVGKN